jgi:hypothetical protein
MATVSGGYKINATVAGGVQITGGSNTTTLYTAPANSFAIVQISILVTTTFGTANWRIYGNGVYVVNPVSIGIGSSSSTVVYGIYIGPGQTVVSNVIFDVGSGQNFEAYVSGVEFKNI